MKLPRIGVRSALVLAVPVLSAASALVFATSSAPNPYVRGPIVILKADFDATQSGSTLFITTDPDNGNFHPLQAFYQIEEVSGLTVAATVSMGTNSSSYNNIIPATVLSTVVDGTKTATADANAPTVPPSTDIKIKVGLPSTASVCKFKVGLLGFYD